MPLRLYTLAAPSDDVAHPVVAQVKAPVVQVPRLAACRCRSAGLAPPAPARPGAVALRRGAACRRGPRPPGPARLRCAPAGWPAQLQRRRRRAPAHALHLVAGRRGRAGVGDERRAVLDLGACQGHLPVAPGDLRRKMNAARFTVTCTEFNCRTLRRAAPAGQRAPHVPRHRRRRVPPVARAPCPRWCRCCSASAGCARRRAWTR